MIVPVILCGGSGTRLWPLSRRLYPKQFHNLHGGDSLLQQTAERARRVCGAPDLIVVTNEEQKFLVADQLGSITGLNVLIEPMPRNTAQCTTLSPMISRIIPKRDSWNRSRASSPSVASSQADTSTAPPPSRPWDRCREKINPPNRSRESGASR